MAFRALQAGERKRGAWQGAASLALVTLAMLLVAVSAAAAPGDPDLSFNGTGVRTYTPGGKTKFSVGDVAVQPDGKILVASRGASTGANTTDGDFVVQRLNADGSPDATFGDGGATVVGFDAFAGANTDDYPTSIALQSTGKILVAGFSRHGNTPYAVIARLNTNGVLDSGFAGDIDGSSGGRILLALGTGGSGGIGTGGPDEANDMIVLPDDRIVVVGVDSTYNPPSRFFALGLTANGARDATFNGRSPVGISFNADAASAEAIARAPNGDLLLAGSTTSTSFTDNLAVARLSPTGELVSSFGTGGKRILSEVGNGTLTDVAVQPDGGIVLAAAIDRFAGDANSYPQGLIRLSSGGGYDSLAGQIFLPITPGPAAFYVPSLAIDPAGRIIFASKSITGTGNNPRTLNLTRVLPSGALDTTFGGGTGTTSTFIGNAAANGQNYGEPMVYLQPDGGIDVALTVNNQVNVRRFQGDPAQAPPDPITPPIDGPPAPDTTAPEVGGAKQSAVKWRAGNGQATFSRFGISARPAKAPVGTTFSWTLSEAATMTFAFDAIKPGRKTGKKCVAPRKSNSAKKKCTRYLSKGTLTRSFEAGAHKLGFQGRITKSKKLSPGSYRLTIGAVDAAGNRAAATTLKFTIVR